MKKVLYAVLAFIIVGAIAFWIVDKPLPEGEVGPRAEALADEILSAINVEAWDTIPYVAWSFRGTNHYVWDKEKHVASVKWNNAAVVLDLNTIEGRAEEAGEVLTGKDAEEAIKYAYTNWCNDSFWLNAPAKIRDPGTMRSLVTLDDGAEALLVEYSSGGVTPGDAYLWVTGDDGLPAYYRMWVEIIPVGGLKATWEGWGEYGGALLASEHRIGPAAVPVENIRVGEDPSDFGLPSDHFTAWRE